MSFEFGTCPCGGIYSPRWIEVRMTVRGAPLIMEEVPQGACPSCGGRVYKAATLRCLESVMKEREFDLD